MQIEEHVRWRKNPKASLRSRRGGEGLPGGLERLQEPRKGLLGGRTSGRADRPPGEARPRDRCSLRGGRPFAYPPRDLEGLSKDELKHVALLAIPTLGFPQGVKVLTWIEDVTEPPLERP